MNSGSKEPDRDVRKLLSRDDIRASLDVIMHVSNRVDSMYADGDFGPRDIVSKMVGTTLGISLPPKGGVLDAFVEVLATLIRRNEID